MENNQLIKNALLISVLASPCLTYAAHLTIVDRSSNVYAYAGNDETGLGEALQDAYTQPGVFSSEIQTSSGMYASQASTANSGGISFTSAWAYNNSIGYGSIDAISEMSVTFDVTQDSNFNMSWVSEGVQRRPQEQQMSAYQRISLTRSGDAGSLFNLMNDYSDTVWVYYLWGALASGASCPSGCSNGLLEGELLSGQYTLTLQNLGRGGSGYESRYNAFSNMAFNMDITAVPLPASIWLFGSGLVGLTGFAKRRKFKCIFVSSSQRC